MEALNNPGYVDDDAAADNLPPEVQADIDADFNDTFGDTESDNGVSETYDVVKDELRKMALKLTNGQRRALLIMCLAEDVVTEDGWYKDESKSDPQSRSDRDKGIMEGLSRDTGLGTSPLESVTEACLEDGVVEERRTVRTKISARKNIRLTQEGRDEYAGLPANRSDDEAVVRYYRIRRRQLDIIGLRDEINYERRTLGRPPYDFEPVRNLRTHESLDEHEQKLYEEQAKHLPELGEDDK